MATSSRPVCAVSTEEMPGLVYQKPLIYSKYLPYSERLEAEAEKLLHEIKENLSVTVQKRELWPGALYWTNRLSSYLRAYGYRFSKADHLKLVKLLYELVTIPNLESPLLHTWGNLLGKLLKKWRLLSREDLCLPWQPLYELVKRVIHSNYQKLGMKIYSVHASKAVHFLVSQARVYFPPESTREMLDEWRPLMCPFDLSMVDAINLLSDFLPTLLRPQEHNYGFRLWFEEFIALWLATHDVTSAEEFCVKLFVRLAKDNVGYIDWTPYIPPLFTRILRAFQLPVGPKELRTAAQKCYFGAGKAATLIVSMLGGGSPAQKYLSQLMAALESYYHPSNFGKHTKMLLLFLKELALQFILRLKKERFSKPSWFYFTPDNAKLSEADIDEFVQCLLPAVRMAVFSKVGTQDAAVAMHNLALVRPEMVLPDLLNRTYKALETLTEPHQVTATLQCVISVSRALLSGGAGKYLEGRKHLFSLLFLALPGIDPNDFRKTLVSGLLISALVSSVPLVDCSPSIGHFEMTEEEVELCSLTSQFEDFVLQFLDRCFALVENIKLEQITALDRVISSSNAHESIVGMSMAGTVHSVLVQCSPKIFHVALDKLFRFATSHVFESEVAGRMCAEMCAMASKVNAASTLKLFVPCCVDVIKVVLEDPDQRESEHPDNSLVWNIHLLSQILHARGSALMPYAVTIICCLKSCIHLKCKSAAQHAAKALCNILHCLTVIYPMEFRSTASDFSMPPEEHLFLKDWAVAGDINHLGLKWYVPSEEGYCLVDRILLELLQPELDKLEGFMKGNTIDRESLFLSLQLVHYILLGASSYLPMWKGKQVDGCPSSVVSMERDFYIFQSDSTRVPPEQFSREILADFVHRLAGHVLQHCEDDTKSITKLVQILKGLLLKFGVDKQQFDTRWQIFNQSKIALEDKLHGKKQRTRRMIIDRIHLLHEYRVLARSMSTLTPLHLTLLKDIFRMSISTYTEVRIKAQLALSSCLDIYLYSGRKLLPDIWPLLSSSNDVSHEQFKGALHLLMLSPVISVILHDWELMRCTLPALVKADHSEKPTIHNLMNKILHDIVMKYDSFTIQFQVPESCATVAATLHAQLSSKEVDEGKARTEEVNQSSIQSYTELVNILVEAVEQEKLQWRYSQMATKLLLMLIRHDHPFPLSGVRLLVRGLTHDLLAIRKVAIKAVSPILLQQKRKHVKLPVDVCKEAGIAHLDMCIPPGERDDNKWLCYYPEVIPRTAEQWDSFPFIDKTHWGYRSWPKTLLTYAPYKEQPQLDRELKELSETEQVFYDAFSSPEFMEKLMAFLSMEENKGKDKYDTDRFNMLKGLFRNFGRMLLPLFKPHLEKLAVDSQESSQRCASEIIAGLISGSKHWSFEMVEELRNFLEPLIKKILEAVTPETMEDWGSCFTDASANRDPRRIHWLLEVLMINPLHGTNGSFMDAGRLYLLQCALAQQEWRVATLLHRLLDYLRPYLAHPFRTVREQIGSTLALIYLSDASSIQVKFNPLRKDFLTEVYPAIPDMDQLATLDRNGDDLKLCKTVLRWLISSYHRSEPELFRLLARLLPLVTVEDDDEIGPLVKAACSWMCHAELSLTNVPPVLSCLHKAIESTLWRVRVPALQVLQVMVFGNLFTFSTVSTEITDVLLRLTEDSQIEVRELAASTVSGLVRCGYISCTDKLKALFIGHSRTRLPKRAKSSSGTGGAAPEATRYEVLLVKRHSGVLGLAALVEACPYTVPEWLPEVLDEIALHLHDPAPIQATVKKTMSEFRRTHHDSWVEHKQKFTDDQLAVLTDLLVSPSYYA